MERYRGGLSSEVIAAISKLMTDDELSNVARVLFNELPGNEIAIGSRYHLDHGFSQTARATTTRRYCFQFLKD